VDRSKLKRLPIRSSSAPVIVSNVNGAPAHRLVYLLFFRRADVSADGPSTTYVRDGQEGRKLRFHFCPTCGTSVYWFADTSAPISSA
jgi:hypothetical protein